MTALAELTGLIGKWQGANRLWLHPEAPLHISETLAVKVAYS